VRERAEGVLRRLAGDHATLREDQWRAIEALTVDRRRVLCVSAARVVRLRLLWNLNKLFAGFGGAYFICGAQ